MLRVTVELIPGGRGEPEVLGTVLIVNDGTGTDRVGNYDAKGYRRGRQAVPADWHTGSIRSPRVARVEVHARNSKSVWVLVSKVLSGMGYR